MLITRPQPASTMPGSTARVTLNVPFRFTPSTSSHIARVILRNDLSRVMPALLTRMSTRAEVLDDGGHAWPTLVLVGDVGPVAAGLDAWPAQRGVVGRFGRVLEVDGDRRAGLGQQ